MKKMMALLLCLGMLMGMPAALAAPARDAQHMDIMISDVLQNRIDMAVGDVVEQEVRVYVYAAAFDGEKATVYGDVYSCDMEEGGSVEYLPEDMVTWLYNCVLTLTPDLDAEAGYEVASLDVLSPLYRSGSPWLWEETQNEAYSYSFNLPTGFELKENVPERMVWQMAEGETLAVDAFENVGYDTLLQDYMNAPTGEVLLEKAEFGYFSTYGDTFYEVHVAVDGTPYAYILRLDFPQERQGEYLLYGDLIRNSFFVWGGAVG